MFLDILKYDMLLVRYFVMDFIENPIAIIENLTENSIESFHLVL